MSDLPQYTARNSRRWDTSANLPPPGPQFIPEHRIAAQADRQKRIQHAVALRFAYRLEQDAKHAFERTSYQRGIQALLWRLYAIREAENLEVLLVNDRQLAGMIEGARAFAAVDLREVDLLRTLRESAFTYRLKELQP